MSEPCHGGCTCGCCEGVEALTPLDTSNRPGLESIRYRAGTHSSFLETMRARLSSQEHPELGALTTREENDPSLALLDAWATVADVLTFYQERIANEGYLRTATERRSVRELARLVGYELRPGVAASTHLAFTLDPGPEVVIPAGTRAQSVPGPGELPAPFETSADLTARAAWNNLRVRQTRPQLPEDVTPTGGQLFFKGITTNLKPNDPLLIRTVQGQKPQLYRVLKVESDAVADRTRVTFEPWLRASANTVIFSEVDAAAAPPPPISLADINAPFLEIAERAQDPEQAGFSLNSATARRVLSHLEPLRASEEADLRPVVNETILPKLRDEHRLAVEGRMTRLEPWIGNLIAELETAAASEPEPLWAEEPAPESFFEEEMYSTDDDTPSNSAESFNVLDQLGKEPSKPPRSPAHVPRDLENTFDSRSDTWNRLLLATRPELRKVFYKALERLPVAKQPVLEVCALRLRASVFGHNAPLELIRREEDGVITGTKEWDLRAPETGAGGTFHIWIRCQFYEGQPTGARITINLDNSSAQYPVNPGEFLSLLQNSSILINVGGETVTLTVSPPSLIFRCLPRGLNVTISMAGDWEVTTEEGESDTVDLDTVRIDPDTDEGSHVFVMGRSLRTSPREEEDVVFLDTTYPQILPASWIVLERPNANLNKSPLVITTAEQVSEQSRAVYGITGKSTRVKLKERWLRLRPDDPVFPVDTFAVIRGTTVYAQCELLELAEMPIQEDLCEGALELVGLYDGLEPGRWLIVSGERADVRVTAPDGTVEKLSGIPAAELVMVAGVEQGVVEVEEDWDSLGRTTPRPGERTHTTLALATDLAYCYKRDTVVVWGNVAPATHGETRSEVLGSGRGSEPWQRFTLKQSPLTHVSARTPSGIESTLRVRVNDVLWHEAPSLFGLEPTDHVYTTRADEEGQTTVVFGDGKRGARLPTGAENVRAVYRVGIGKPGNLDDGRISQLVTRPLGVKEVINPLPATGGADAESRDQAKRNAPLAVMALDRLVSIQDYANFARTFAGIGRAVATRISDGRSQLVHVTIAGEDDIPIATTSELFANLSAALRQFGDPHLRVELAVRDVALLVIAAGVRLLPDYLWEAVVPKIRASLLSALGFERRDLAQGALLSEAIRAIQSVPGVDYVDVDVFDRASAAPNFQLKSRISASPARLKDQGSGTILPAQLVYLSPAVPDLIILKELKA